MLSVTLPARKPESNGEARGVVIRIPEQGGRPPENGLLLPRGLLLLRVEPAEVADPGVSRVLPAEQPVSDREAGSRKILEPNGKQAWLLTAVVVIVILASLVALAIRRHGGAAPRPSDEARPRAAARQSRAAAS